MESLARRFKERLPDWLENIGRGIENRNQESLCSAAHVLKGLGGTFGFPEITEMSREIESCGKKQDFESAESLFNELRKFCQKI